MSVNSRNVYRKPPATEENAISPSLKSASSDKFIMYCGNHVSAILASAGRLLRSPISTLMTLIVIGIALALPTSLFVLLANVKHVSENWNDNSQISLYLKSNLSANQTQSVMTQLLHQPGIAKVKYISSAQGLVELQNQTDLQDALSVLNQNPLPGVILVEPNKSIQSPGALNQLLQNLQQLPEIDIAQLDMQWVKRLYAMIDLAKHLVYALGCLLGIGVLFIIGNTIHLNLQKYQREIEIFKLVGATDGFIRRPFLYTGILYGFLGSIFALILVALLLLGIYAPVHRLANLYNSNFHLQGITFSSAFSLLLTGILLGLTGAWLAVGKHLRAN